MSAIDPALQRVCRKYILYINANFNTQTSPLDFEWAWGGTPWSGLPTSTQFQHDLVPQHNAGFTGHPSSGIRHEVYFKRVSISLIHAYNQRRTGSAMARRLTPLQVHSSSSHRSPYTSSFKISLSLSVRHLIFGTKYVTGVYSSNLSLHLRRLPQIDKASRLQTRRFSFQRSP